MKVIYDRESMRVPIKIWAGDLEEGCLRQLHHLANLPFAFHHVAAMPDAHEGYGMPIGGVLAARGAIIPNAVGVDIGCGMALLDTGLQAEQVRPVLRQILNDIQRSIPHGFARHKSPQDSDIFVEAPVDLKIIDQELESARYQLCTLGGGNHFIEVQSDKDGLIYVMLHSGSRNLGKKVADYYNKLAVKLNRRWHMSVPEEWQLAFLPTDSQEGQDYLRAMNFCLAFARENRRLMLDRIEDILERFIPEYRRGAGRLDVHHNYARLENHFGENVMVHRKGAVRAQGQVIIPGSMGSSSYIARGLENTESFWSCSHGAGRVMSRSQARKEILVDNVILEMREMEIELFKVNKSDVAEECRQAYKDIGMVMRQQEDLAEALVELRPLGVVKG